MSGIRVVLAALACAAMVEAGERPKRDKPRKQDDSEVSNIAWHKSAESAIRAATKPTVAKPVFLFRALGDLDGKL